MPINVYTGLQGSGKTYEVVGSVILPALLKGRRVVTNIEGLDNDKIKAYAMDNDPDAVLGQVVTVTNHQVSEPGFFPVSQEDTESIVKGGDLVCIDEAWRFFGTDIKITPQVKIFLREHRHFSDAATGVTCDLALMMQSVQDLHRSVKSVVELSFKTHKLKTVGLNRRYRLDMFEGTNQKLGLRCDSWQKSYDPAIYDLYHSYAGGVGRELAIDTRQNVLKNPRNLFIMAGALLFFAAGAYALHYIYARYTKPHDAALPAADSSSAVVPGTRSVAAAPAAPAAAPRPVDSESWRLAGRLVTPFGERAILAGAGSRVRVEDPALFVGHGWGQRGFLDGEKVSAWSGPVPGGSGASESKVMSIGK